MAKEKILGAKAKAEAPLQLVFSGDFKQDLTGELKPGSEVTILFDSARLPFERSVDEKGKPAWTISAFYQFSPAGAVNKVDLVAEKTGSRKKVAEEGTTLKGVFTIPQDSEEAIIWFLNTGPTGNKYYDSAFGKNYRFRVLSEVIETASVEAAPVKKRRAKQASS